MNNSAESQPTNGKVAQPKSENKAKVEKDGRDSTNQSMVESTTETLPSADITEPNVPSNTSKDKEESTSNQTDAGQLKSETNVASNEADKSPSKADTEVSNKPSTSASSEAKDKMTSTEDSQKLTWQQQIQKIIKHQLVHLQMQTIKLRKTTVPMHLQLQFQMEAIVLIKICLM